MGPEAPGSAAVPRGADPDPGDPEASRLTRRLEEFIRAHEQEASRVEVSGLRRADVGYSRENWTFDARWSAGGQEGGAALIMRRDPEGSVLVTDRRVEYALLRALEGTDLPAPRARWLDGDGTWFGRPSLVMDRIEGECRMFAIEGPDPLEDRLRLAHDCLELLAAVHRVDWRSAGLGALLPGGDRPGAATEVAHWERELRAHQMEDEPRLDEVVTWLRANAPEPQAAVLVHGDFKPGNMLLREGAIVALLDWETAHIGDPVEDVGWITNPLRHREHQIPGRWEREQIVARYEELTGFTVGGEQLRFWNVLANFKLVVIVLTGIRSHAEGRSDRSFGPPTALVDLARRLAGLDPPGGA